MKLSELCVLFPHSIVVLFLSKQMMLNYRKSHLLLITMSRIGLFLYLLYTLRITTKNIFFRNYYEVFNCLDLFLCFDISKIWWRQFLYSFKEISLNLKTRSRSKYKEMILRNVWSFHVIYIYISLIWKFILKPTYIDAFLWWIYI